MKVIYIAGLGHSGSTLLDLLLSQHPDVIGLGEALRFVKGHKKNYEETAAVCSCGASLKDCIFWSPLLSMQGVGVDDASMRDAYRRIFAQAKACNADVVVDSSKHIDGVRVLTQLEQAGEIELHVIFLIRDVRGWVNSSQKSAKRAHMVPRPAFVLMRRWYREQLRMISDLAQYHPSYVCLSYEKLCHDTNDVLKQIATLCGLNPFSFERASRARSHVVMGNRLKMKTTFPVQIQYDDAWRKKYLSRFCLLLSPRIFQWNKQMVHDQPLTKNPT